ncbi:MAG: NUDIX hydrolase [Lishizhenia sp.]
MYKVFIENKPLYFVDNTKDLPKNTFFLSTPPNKTQLALIEESYSDKKNKIVYAVISKDPLKLLVESFSHYKYIEAAGGLVEKKKNKQLLFIKRNGFWDIPKGKLEKNESVLEGAKREIEEECGISNLIENGKICDTYHTYSEKGKKILKKTYWFSFYYKGKEKLIAQTEEGITKVKWFEADNLFKVRKNTFASILEVVDNFIEFNTTVKKQKNN